MGFGFSDLTPEGKKYFRELKKMTDMEIQVGFQGDQKYEDGHQHRPGSPPSTSSAPRTSRSGRSCGRASRTMRASFRRACDTAQRLVSSGGSAEQALQQIGVIAKGLVQDEIVNGGFAPNAESTIKKKGSEQPLIDHRHHAAVRQFCREAERRIALEHLAFQQALLDQTVR